MHIIRPERLEAFWAKHPKAEGPLRSWYDTADAARWQSPDEVKATYGTASILKGGRVVFDIGGNKYRLVAKIRFDTKIVFVRFVGTHAEYDRIDANTV